MEFIKLIYDRWSVRYCTVDNWSKIILITDQCHLRSLLAWVRLLRCICQWICPILSCSVCKKCKSQMQLQWSVQKNVQNKYFCSKNCFARHLLNEQLAGCFSMQCHSWSVLFSLGKLSFLIFYFLYKFRSNLDFFLMSFLIFSSLNATLFQGSRYIWASARERHFPSFISCINRYHDSPRAALFVHVWLILWHFCFVFHSIKFFRQCCPSLSLFLAILK